MLSKFKNNYCTKEYDNYERVVCLCYDLDVFKYSQKPPVNRKELEKALLKVGAHKVIKIVEGLINQLNLEKILSHICNQLKPLCDELGYGCDGKKCNGNKKVQ